MPKKIQIKNKKKSKDESDDDLSDFDITIGSDSEETTSDEDDMAEEEESAFQDAQGWPDTLEDYYPTESDDNWKERVNALFSLYKDYHSGKRTTSTMTKAEVGKVADIGNHMVRKPKDKKNLDWLSQKILSLVQDKKKRQKGTPSVTSENEFVASPSPSASIDLASVSILNPPPSQSSSGVKRPPNSPVNQSPTKKARAFFTTDEGDGTPMINGFPINCHPKQHKKNKPGEPTDVQVTEGYALDDDTHM